MDVANVEATDMSLQYMTYHAAVIGRHSQTLAFSLAVFLLSFRTPDHPIYVSPYLKP